MKFTYSKTFLKWLEKFSNKKTVKEKINLVLIDFKQNLFKSEFYRKKLKWYNDIHELYVTWDIRIIIKIIIIDDECRFMAIWTHSILF